MAGSPTRGVRLAELIASLSLAMDIGLGMPMEYILRSTWLAMQLGEELGLDQEERASLYYTGLLFWVGCHSDSYEQAELFGDDIALRGGWAHVDLPRTRDLIGAVGTDRAPIARARMRAAFAAKGGRQVIEEIRTTHCQVADGLANGLGLESEVNTALGHCFERWDGEGVPHRRRGEDVAIESRLLNLAFVAGVFGPAEGPQAAVAVARERSGTQFDPRLVEIFADKGAELMSEVERVTGWDELIESEPGLGQVLNETALDETLLAVADYADLKTPSRSGHSRALADLVAEAARGEGLAPERVTLLRRAALVHDLGRLGVPNSIWDKQGSLTAAEWERVRLYPYMTARVLAFSPRLAPVGELAATHQERMDGSGYPRGSMGSVHDAEQRLLAACDCYQAMIEPRPHRTALSPDAAASELQKEARAGRLDGDAVNAALRAAGHRTGARTSRPAGLTAREVEVLGLLARGRSNKEIASRLVITPKTAGNHVQNIYSKIDVSNRAAASLFAMQSGLLSTTTADE